MVVTDISVCRDADIDAESARICTAVGLEPRSLDDTPFALVGEPQRIADKIEAITERLGLAWIAVPYADLELFFAEIAPLLS